MMADNPATERGKGRCPECEGVLYAPGEPRKRGRKKVFCSVRCQEASNERRHKRGAQLYDLVMARKFVGKDDPDWSRIQHSINHLTEQWRADDWSNSLKAHRETWLGWRRLLQRKSPPPRSAEPTERVRPEPYVPQPRPSAPPERQGPPRPSLAMSLSTRIVVEKRKRHKQT